MTDVLIVLTNLPDEAAAHALAERLVRERRAACVNVLAPCRSVYRWQGAVEHAQETPLLIKTTRTGYAALEAAILAHHPYELPEIVAVPVQQGFAPYLAWVAGEVEPGPRTPPAAQTPPALPKT
ncbi:divalent-cation tolerance protein CutA [Thauera sinica]|uniref:Divalent-cation tolerance protein CutA n=1 Tax=Thauera sinica TaxID=2665146 RepID=A0ABW1APP4_9RHOO|nr:divalent-cation tolerance protein CutA [Thauera sp. K11]ATE61553.1 divalent-cation tolerance protein CutA [Thauera sp. K11]